MKELTNYKKYRCFLLIIILVLTANSCTGIDTARPPKTSAESEQKGLLLSRYKASQDTVLVKGERYIIKDAWTTHWLKSRTSKEINTEFYEFYVSIENMETGKFSKTHDGKALPVENIKYKGERYGYTNGVGISSGLLSINFLTKNKPITPDTIILSFRNFNTVRDIYFTKQ